jgi:exopolysaccharide production protein ExoZ
VGAVSGRRAQGSLRDVQALRGIAAAMVMCYHSGSIYALTTESLLFGNLFRGGFLGVDIFFVLSGFVMYWAHADDLGKPGAASVFIKKRLFRILPVYWVVVAFKVLKEWRTVDPLTIVCALLLIPYPRAPFVIVSWTLSYEMMFYAAVAIMIVLPRGWLTLVPPAVLLAMSLIPGPVAWTNEFWDVLAAFPFNAHLSEFLLGLGVGWIQARRVLNERWGPWVLGLGLLAAVSLYGTATWLSMQAELSYGVSAYHLAERDSHPIFHHGVWLFGVPFAAVLLGLVMCEQTSGRAKLPFLGWLGDASYALYLVHGFVIFAVLTRPALNPFLTAHPWAMLGTMGLALTAGLALHHLVEKPLSKALKPWVFGKPTPKA